MDKQTAFYSADEHCYAVATVNVIF